MPIKQMQIYYQHGGRIEYEECTLSIWSVSMFLRNIKKSCYFSSQFQIQGSYQKKLLFSHVEP